MKKILIAIVLLILLPAIVSATNYYISTSGSDSNSGTSTSSAWRTIGRANSELRLGDTVYIRAGTYSPTIRPARSGTAGNYITYTNYNDEQVTITGSGDGVDLRNRHYIVIDGLRIIEVSGSWVNMHGGDESHSSTHNIIKNCYMKTSGDWAGIYMKYGVEHNKILDNTLIGTCYTDVECPESEKTSAGACIGGPRGPDDLLYCRDGCHYNVVEGNYFGNSFHTALNFHAREGIGTSHNVLRNNIISNRWHICLSTSANAHWSLIEGNIIYDCGEEHDTNWCGSTRDRTMTPVGINHAAEVMRAMNCISRKNVYFNCGSGISIDTLSDGQDGINNRVYQNTLYKNEWGFNTNCVEATYDNIYKNNIVYATRDHAILKTISNEPRDNYYINNNILGGTIRVLPGDGEQPLSYFENNYPSEWYGNLAVNPQFVDANRINDNDNRNFNPSWLNLQSSSPMINAGAWLTRTTNSGTSSRTIRVDDANYFYDGWGIEGEIGDLIQLQGSATTARITNIDYSSNTITIDRSLTWTSGTGVALAYSGNAPDMGAYEYGGSTPPPTDCTGDCIPSSCSNYDNCISASGTCSSGYCCQGSCTTPPQQCSDGTAYSQCSTTRPLYCSNGNLISRCDTCECPIGQECQADGTCQSEPIQGLSWEAEDGAISSPFVVTNGYVYQASTIYDYSIAGRASYTFNIDNAGEYIIKAMVDAPTGGANSFFLNIDSESTEPYMIWDIIDLTTGFEERTVRWRDPTTLETIDTTPIKVFTLSAGQHQLIIRGREGDTWIDKITIESYGGGGGQCIPGDMPLCDRVVDLFDLTFIITRFGTTPNHSNWDSAADMADPKNIIDIFDVVFVASRMT